MSSFILISAQSHDSVLDLERKFGRFVMEWLTKHRIKLYEHVCGAWQPTRAPTLELDFWKSPKDKLRKWKVIDYVCVWSCWVCGCVWEGGVGIWVGWVGGWVGVWVCVCGVCVWVVVVVVVVVLTWMLPAGAWVWARSSMHQMQ